MLSGTEAEILNSVARLREATKGQIRKQVDFSLGYVDFICRYLVRKGYLIFMNGCYSLSRQGMKTLLIEEPRIDKNIIKEIAAKIVKEINERLKREGTGRIEIPATQIEQRERKSQEQIYIKTDFDFPVADESLALESNINKIEVKLEKERSDIDESVRLFRKIHKEERRK